MLKIFGGLLFSIFLSSCATAAEDLAAPRRGEPAKRIFVVIHGWHSGVALDKAGIPPGLLPEAEDFPGAESLEVGWGDWDFYPAPDPGLGLATRAAFFSRASVLHVVGFSGTPRDYFPEADIFELRLSEEGFRRLIRFVSDTFVREQSQRRAQARSGVYPDSLFYPARGRFHLFRNCNTWVAEALQAAGLAISPSAVVTAGSLAARVKNLSP